MAAQIRPATITGDSQTPAEDGVAILVSGSARVILDLPGAYRFAAELAKVIDSLLGEDPAHVLIRQLWGQAGADYWAER